MSCVSSSQPCPKNASCNPRIRTLFMLSFDDISAFRLGKTSRRILDSKDALPITPALSISHDLVTLTHRLGIALTHGHTHFVPHAKPVPKYKSTPWGTSPPNAKSLAVPQPNISCQSPQSKVRALVGGASHTRIERSSSRRCARSLPAQTKPAKPSTISALLGYPFWGREPRYLPRRGLGETLPSAHR